MNKVYEFFKQTLKFIGVLTLASFGLLCLALFTLAGLEITAELAQVVAELAKEAVERAD